LSDTSSSRWTLRDLPFAARLAIAAFLISVGIGYLSALVQLHFKHAKTGELMPTGEDAVAKFHGRVGEPPESRLVRLVMAAEDLKFDGSGQMAQAFTKRAKGWNSLIASKARALAKGKADEEVPDEARARAEQEVRKEREGEKAAVVAWLKGGADWEVFERDRFVLTGDLANRPVTPEFVEKDGEEAVLKIKTLWTERCIRCHAKEGGDPKAGQYPLETREQVAKYNKVEESTAMTLESLAQTTHVHLLGFSMLYGLTGLILALTSLPAIIRVPLAPLALIAQVVDISFWWLARLDAPHGPLFATLIPVSGGVVAVSLLLQILLSLFDLFGKGGKAVLLLLALAAGAGGFVVKEKVIDPHLAKEKASVASQQ
jgi:hypothetical protein